MQQAFPQGAVAFLYTRRMALHHLLNPCEEPGNITVCGCLSRKNDAGLPAVCIRTKNNN